MHLCHNKPTHKLGCYCETFVEVQFHNGIAFCPLCGSTPWGYTFGPMTEWVDRMVGNKEAHPEFLSQVPLR